VATTAEDQALARALEATRESRKIAFQGELSDAAAGSWFELLKDIAAMANAGGGIILVGVNGDGTESGWDPLPLLNVDMAEFASRFAKYFGEQLDDLEIVEAMKERSKVAAIRIGPRTGTPVVFERSGTYSDGHGGEKTAFARGSMYFRHGAKSEPGTSGDVRRFINREVDRQRRALLGNVRKVAGAPKGSQVILVPPKSSPPTDLTNVRVVDDPDAPAVGRTDFDVTHPHRQTEVIRLVNERLGGNVINSFDILCVRRTHDVHLEPRYFHKPKFGSPQYSDAFVDWLTAQYQEDRRFFEKARERTQSARTSREP
jgi:hypothetical protein